MANCTCGGQLKQCTKCGTILCGHSNQGALQKGTLTRRPEGARVAAAR